VSIDLLLFALIAAFLVFRLRNVLGRRTGNERPPTEPNAQRGGQQPAPAADDDESVVTLPGREPEDTFIEQAEGDLGENLRKIRGADSSFNSEQFAEGGRAAFEMIVTSFASGDRETLRPLLSDEVYENFAGAIVERADKGNTMEMTLVGIRSSDIIEASMDGRVAFVTIKFVTEQIEVTRDSAGEVLDGDPSRVTTVSDIWTFARNTRSRNPNWTLVATEAPN
jgi:predicted lipid-binding transport protein (Tim44 family)